MTFLDFQTEDYFDLSSGKTYCLMGDAEKCDLYQLDEDGDWEIVDDPDDDELKIKIELASLEKPSTPLYQRIDVIPYLAWKGEYARIPYPLDDEERPCYVRGDSQLEYLFQPLHQQKLLAEGVSYSKDLVFELEKYHELLCSELDDQFGFWFNDKEDFFERYGEYDGAMFWDELMKLYEKVVDVDAFDELRMHANMYIFQDSLFVRLSLGDSDVFTVLDGFIEYLPIMLSDIYQLLFIDEGQMLHLSKVEEYCRANDVIDKSDLFDFVKTELNL